MGRRDRQNSGIIKSVVFFFGDVFYFKLGG